MMDTRIWSVFPACGKSWLFDHQEKYGLKIMDSDSSKFSWCMRKRTEEEAADFLRKAAETGNEYTKLSDIEAVHNEVLRLRNPEFPKNYIEHIKDSIGKCDYIFVSSHEDVRKAMADAGLTYTLVYPNIECLAEWVGRCYLRELEGNNGFPIKVLIDNWEKWIEQCTADPGASNRIRLKPGQFLANVLPSQLWLYKGCPLV